MDPLYKEKLATITSILQTNTNAVKKNTEFIETITTNLGIISKTVIPSIQEKLLELETRLKSLEAPQQSQPASKPSVFSNFLGIKSKTGGGKKTKRRKRSRRKQSRRK